MNLLRLTFCRDSLRLSFFSFSVSPSLLLLSRLSFHIYDRPVMCTQDRWGQGKMAAVALATVWRAGGE